SVTTTARHTLYPANTFLPVYTGKAPDLVPSVGPREHRESAIDATGHLVRRPDPNLQNPIPV
ncbi:MAG TPA: hypothetical protein VIO57_05420, partial [Chloroflexota bacterium]